MTARCAYCDAPVEANIARAATTSWLGAYGRSGRAMSV
jgi:hypothetical protein